MVSSGLSRQGNYPNNASSLRAARSSCPVLKIHFSSVHSSRLDTDWTRRGVKRHMTLAPGAPSHVQDVAETILGKVSDRLHCGSCRSRRDAFAKKVQSVPGRVHAQTQALGGCAADSAGADRDGLEPGKSVALGARDGRHLADCCLVADKTALSL